MPEIDLNRPDIRLILAAVVFTLLVFAFDLSVPLGIAAGVPYVGLVLFGWFFKRKHAVLKLAIGASILVVIGFLVSDKLVNQWIVVANRLLALFAIWIVAALLTIIKRRENSLRELNAQLDQKIHDRTTELEKKNKELAQFVYIASHDLQEPVRSIISFSDLLNEQYAGQFDETGKTSLSYLTKASYRMSDLIKSLLDHSRIGKEKEVGVIDTNRLIVEIKEDLTQLIAETNTKIFSKGLPKITVFPTDFRLLFQNLIANAIKFSNPAKAPEIHIEAKEFEGYWQFSVTDNGLGIEKEYHDRIFRIFQRLHKKDEFEGTGIGLAHCRKIVELHQGKIWLESDPGMGSTFYFTINKKLK